MDVQSIPFNIDEEIKKIVLPEEIHNIMNNIDNKKLPINISISTITIVCKLEEMKFNVENIGKYLDLENDPNIFSVYYGSFVRINNLFNNK